MQRVNSSDYASDSLTYFLVIAAAGGGGGEEFGLGKMFADSNLLGKLAANPRTQKHLADPSFVQKVGVQEHDAAILTLLTEPRRFK